MRSFFVFLCVALFAAVMPREAEAEECYPRFEYRGCILEGMTCGGTWVQGGCKQSDGEVCTQSGCYTVEGAISSCVDPHVAGGEYIKPDEFRKRGLLREARAHEEKCARETRAKYLRGLREWRRMGCQNPKTYNEEAECGSVWDEEVDLHRDDYRDVVKYWRRQGRRLPWEKTKEGR